MNQCPAPSPAPSPPGLCGPHARLDWSPPPAWTGFPSHPRPEPGQGRGQGQRTGAMRVALRPPELDLEQEQGTSATARDQGPGRFQAVPQAMLSATQRHGHELWSDAQNCKYRVRSSDRRPNCPYAHSLPSTHPNLGDCSPQSYD